LENRAQNVAFRYFLFLLFCPGLAFPSSRPLSFISFGRVLPLVSFSSSVLFFGYWPSRFGSPEFPPRLFLDFFPLRSFVPCIALTPPHFVFFSTLFLLFFTAHSQFQEDGTLPLLLPQPTPRNYLLKPSGLLSNRCPRSSLELSPLIPHRQPTRSIPARTPLPFPPLPLAADSGC